MGFAMFSNAMAFAFPTDVRTVPIAGKNAINAKKMDKTAFMDFNLRNYTTGIAAI
jgi:hypothetical protein